jgi:hypothetical protein
MTTLLRPIKTGGNREYAIERANGFIKIKSAEVDADLDTIYSAWNSGNLPWQTNSIPPSAINPTGGSVGYVLQVGSGGTAGWGPVPAGDSLWVDEPGPKMLVPLKPAYGVALQDASDGLVFRHSNYPTVDRSTGISADDNLFFLTVASNGLFIRTSDMTSILARMTAAGLWRLGDFTAPTEQLELVGGVKIGAALQTADGTLQYTGTKFQGRVSGAWVDLGGGLVPISSTAPVSPSPGQLWWRTTDGNLYIWYFDGTTSQWVPVMATVGRLTGGNYYLVSGALAGVPTTSLSVGFYVAALPFTFKAGLTGSQAVAKIAATGSSSFDVRVNGVSKGSITWSAGATVATFTWTADVAVAAGDRIEVLAPASPDATLSDPTWTLRGNL